MIVVTGQSLTVTFPTRNVAGVLTNASSITGTLVVNGADNGATVTVTNLATGRYKAAVTLPALTIGDVVEIRVAGTIDSTPDEGIVMSGTIGISQTILATMQTDLDTVAATTATTLSRATDIKASTDYLDGLAIDGSGHVILQNASLTTAKLGTFALAKTTNITGFNDLSAAQVNTEADTALSDVGLTTTITGRIDAAITSRMASYVQPTGFLVADFTRLDAAITSRMATFTLPTNFSALSITAGGEVDAGATGGASAADVADAVLDELLSGHTIPGSAGKKLSDTATAADIAAGVNITITPLQANSANPRYSTRAMAPIAQHSSPTDIWNITDANGDPVNLAGKTVRQVFAQVTDEGDDPFELVDDTVEGSFKYETGSGEGITIGGDDDNQVTVVHDADKLDTAGRYVWWLWNITDGIVLLRGTVPIEPSVLDVA